MWRATTLIVIASLESTLAQQGVDEGESQPPAQSTTDTGDGKCLLIGSNPPIKTTPSLSFCFRNNVSGACCLTGHDQLIRSQYSAFIPEMC